ncbi:MAG: DegV family protein [Desulfobacteraceae bacterium]
MKRLIVTDSTSDLSDDMMEKLGVKIIPVNIILDGETYKDREELGIKDFYSNFELYNSMKTKPVSYEQYSFHYLELTAEYDEIIFIHCSKHLSKTYENALKAHRYFEDKHDCRIEIIDSRHCGMGLGLIVIEAAKAVGRGESFEDIIRLVNDLSERITTYMTVPSLKYLRANQKISGLKSVIGNVMGIKPVLGFNDGRIVVKTKLTGKSENLLLDLIDHIKEDIGESPVTIALAHARDTRYVSDLVSTFKKMFDCRQMYTAYFGPSVGISTGPDTMGVSFFKHRS